MGQTIKSFTDGTVTIDIRANKLIGRKGKVVWQIYRAPADVDFPIGGSDFAGPQDKAKAKAAALIKAYQDRGWKEVAA